MLRLEDVGFRYERGGDAIAGLSMDMHAGILGLLGPNGAGKSTLMRMLATFTRPSRGRICWKGADVAKHPDVLRATLGYLPQEFGVHAALSAREFLHYLAAVKGLPHARIAARADECLALVGLEQAADRRIGRFSGGMRQRVGIAQALLNDPKLLIVDEPTVGLDPDERLRFRNLLTDLAGQRLVMLSTHIVSDIEASASALAIMDKGRLRFHGSPEALLAQRAWQRLGVDGAGRRPGRRCAPATGSPPRCAGTTGCACASWPRRRRRPRRSAVAPDLEDAYIYLLARIGDGQQGGKVCFVFLPSWVPTCVHGCARGRSGRCSACPPP